MKKRCCKIVALCATKGGVGKTTIATALAVKAAQSRARVALIDSDPQESLAGWHDRRGSPNNPKLFETECTQEAVRLIESEDFDWLIVDTPPAILDLVEQAVCTADFVVIPCRASILDVLAVEPVVEMCAEHGKPFAFVLNGVQASARITQSASEQLAKMGKVLPTRVANRIAYAAGMTAGKTGPEVERDGSATKEIASLWADLGREIAKAGKVRR